MKLEGYFWRSLRVSCQLNGGLNYLVILFFQPKISSLALTFSDYCFKENGEADTNFDITVPILILNGLKNPW